MQTSNMPLMAQRQDDTLVTDTKVRGATVPTSNWHRLALAVIVVIAGFLNFFQQEQNSYGNEFYAAAVRSMLDSWHNFFFVAFDPSGFVTVDKPPLGLWIQTASAAIFGFSGFSIILPQALGGVLSVLVLYCLVRRKFGPIAGLLAALFLALTPISVAMSRDNNLDTLLVLFVLLAAWAVSLAAETGRLRWLMLGAILVALGFNIKTLEAYLVVPALGLLYLLTAPISWRKRILHLVLATLVMLVVSFSWIVVVDMVPASQRPYVDSTSDNSEMSLTLGYNGIQRLLGQSTGTSNTSASSAVKNSTGSTTKNSTGNTSSNTSKSSTGNAASSTPTASPTSTSQTLPHGGFAGGKGNLPHQRAGGGGKTGTSQSGTGTVSKTGTSQSGTGTVSKTGTSQSGTGTVSKTGSPQGGTVAGVSGQRPGGAGGASSILDPGGSPSPFRFFNVALGGQVSWLLPMAILGLLALLWQRRVRLPLDNRWQAAVLWGVWLLTMGTFFSVAGYYHTYYLVIVAPAIAALAAIGLITLWENYRTSSSWHGWILPLALLLTAGEQVYLLSTYRNWNRILSPIVLGLTILAAVILVLARLRPRLIINSNAWLRSTVVVAAAALLLTPSIWSFVTTLQAENTTLPTAGPATTAFAVGGGDGMTARANTDAFSTTATRGETGSETPANPRMGGMAAGGMGGGPMGIGNTTTSDQKLIDYLVKNQGTAEYLMATDRSTSAESIIVATNKPVMAFGGYLGSDPILTQSQLESLIKAGTVRYFLLSASRNPNGSAFNTAGDVSEQGSESAQPMQGNAGGAGGIAGGLLSSGSNQQLINWVEANCSTVSTSLWSSSSTSTGGQQLYDCSSVK